VRLVVEAKPLSAKRLAVVGRYEIIAYKFRIAPAAVTRELESAPHQPYLDVLEASRISGHSPQSIRKLVREGRLEGLKVAGRWRLTRSSIDDLARN
jgi:hypothetical protein